MLKWVTHVRALTKIDLVRGRDAISNIARTPVLFYSRETEKNTPKFTITYYFCLEKGPEKPTLYLPKISVYVFTVTLF